MFFILCDIAFSHFQRQYCNHALDKNFFKCLFRNILDLLFLKFEGMLVRCKLFF